MINTLMHTTCNVVKNTENVSSNSDINMLCFEQQTLKCLSLFYNLVQNKYERLEKAILKNVA